MSIKLIVFDWAGTLVDFGSRAPLIAFLETFEQAALPISEGARAVLPSVAGLPAWLENFAP